MGCFQLYIFSILFPILLSIQWRPVVKGKCKPKCCGSLIDVNLNLSVVPDELAKEICFYDSTSLGNCLKDKTVIFFGDSMMQDIVHDVVSVIFAKKPTKPYSGITRRIFKELRYYHPDFPEDAPTFCCERPLDKNDTRDIRLEVPWKFRIAPKEFVVKQALPINHPSYQFLYHCTRQHSLNGSFFTSADEMAQAVFRINQRNMSVYSRRSNTMIFSRFSGHHDIFRNHLGASTFFEPEFRYYRDYVTSANFGPSHNKRPDAVVLNSCAHDISHFFFIKCNKYCWDKSKASYIKSMTKLASWLTTLQKNGTQIFYLSSVRNNHDRSNGRGIVSKNLEQFDALARKSMKLLWDNGGIYINTDSVYKYYEKVHESTHHFGPINMYDSTTRGFTGIMDLGAVRTQFIIHKICLFFQKKLK